VGTTTPSHRSRSVGQRRERHGADGGDPDRWNVWYRSSSDGGTTWSVPVKLNDHPANAAGYTHPDGFEEIYGDYGEIAVTSEGNTVAAWGEGFSWSGPGGT
jgi:hypothetical protein